MMGALNILDEMQRVLDSDAAQRALISTEMAREISRLSAFAQIRDALVRHQPIIQAGQDCGPIAKSHIARLEPIDALDGKYLTGLKIAEYTKPRSAFYYPAGKKRTKQHVEQMRQAEAKLESFWSSLTRNSSLVQASLFSSGWANG